MAVKLTDVAPNTWNRPTKSDFPKEQQLDKLTENQIIDRIVRRSGRERKQIVSYINHKVMEYAGLLSRRGAIEIVATELGVKRDWFMGHYK